jgi:hypothetical protein
MGFLSLEAGSSVVGEYAAWVSPFIPGGVLLTRQGILLLLPRSASRGLVSRADVTDRKFLSPQLERMGADPPFRTEFRGGQITIRTEAANGLNIELQAFCHILHVQQQTRWLRFSVLGWLERIWFHAGHAA